ncbi:MAG: zf-HC2 domain-containing protein [Gemmataceae bacterium]|nr:zf-HC2 domain-containing protein [Gemmataceae bacterium]
MITCRELAEEMLDFLEGVLAAEHCDRIREHLGHCPLCVTLIETYQITIVLSRQLPCCPLSQNFMERLRQTLAREAAGPGGCADPAPPTA